MDYSLVERLNKAGVEFKKDLTDNSSSMIYMLMSYLLPVLLLWGGLFLIFRLIRHIAVCRRCLASAGKHAET